MNNNTNTINFCEKYTRRQLNALYREIPLKDTTSRTLRKYFCAAANLYGIISAAEMWKLISSMHKTLVTEEEFYAYVKIAVHECESYVILGSDELGLGGKETELSEKEIINVSIAESGIDCYNTIKKMHKDKECNVLDKKTFICYADMNYTENEEETAALREFISARTESEEAADEIFGHIVYLERIVNTDLNGLIKELTEGEKFTLNVGKDEVKKLTDLCVKFHNTLRLPCNNGYSPNEIHEKYKTATPVTAPITLGENMRELIKSGEVDPYELRMQILESKMPNEAVRLSLLKELNEIAPFELPKKKEVKPIRVGRNDPCPCGSGKKYKKCCGR